MEVFPAASNIFKDIESLAQKVQRAKVDKQADKLRELAR